MCYRKVVLQVNENVCLIVEHHSFFNYCGIGSRTLGYPTLKCTLW